MATTVTGKLNKAASQFQAGDSSLQLVDCLV